MKKILCLLLCIAMLVTTVAFVACGEKESETNGTETNETESGTKENPETVTLKFGLGVIIDVSKATNADEDKNGQGKVAITGAAVTVDADGKIVACVLDTADITVEYTNDGKAVAKESFATKYEQGDGYNMKLYGGSAKEWYEQADAFCATVKGKTLSEVQALVADGGKGNDEVISAGCTISVSEFVLAVEKAYNNAVASDATADNTLKLGVNTEQSCKDATEEKDGQNQIETTFFASAVDANGKIVAATADCVQVKFTFDATGASTYDLSKAVSSKRESGANYGMSKYGNDLNGDGVVKEWFEQADAFAAACIGKTAGEVGSLMSEDSYGTADIQSAGCTIAVSGFVKAATKLAK